MSLVEEKLTFASFSNILDARILRALADLGFAHPTLIQAKAIPLALEGKDILARARTGSGKTAAYCIPIIKKIASSKLTLGSSYSVQKTRGLILVPTRELAEQVTSHLGLLLKYFENEIIVVNVASGGTSHLQKYTIKAFCGLLSTAHNLFLNSILLSDQPDIVVATPTKALAFLRSKNLSLAALESLVIDEADLILSYGHDEDVRQILGGSYLPKVFQSFLMSATMTKDVETLKGLILRNPAILRLEEDEDATAQLNQYSIHCSEVDKFLLAYVILKLRLVKGKCIFFVNGVERCYRLKLFLEQFSIKSCVLNSELPLNSRYHIVEEFNKGVYDYIIATDESAGRDEMDSDSDAEADAEAEGETVESAPEPNPEENHIASTNRKRKRSASPPRKKSKRVPKSDKEYGVSRGIDFVSVSCVLNFDLPSSSRAYIHRVGRTARAGKSGIAISFLVPEDEWGKDKVVGCVETTKKDEKVFARIVRKQKQKGHEIKEWAFDQKQVEAFRYRMEDALRSVTKRVIGEARVKEITSEMLNSDKLKAYFEDNPRTLNFLRHDKPLHPTRIQPHLKYVPKYLKQGTVPGEMTADGVDESQETAFIPFKKPSNHTRRGRGRGRGGKSNLGRRKKDPLKGVR